MEKPEPIAAYSSVAETAVDSLGRPSEERALKRRRNFVLGIVNLSHGVNHLESNMLSVLYPVMMQDLGFGYFAIGVLQTLYQLSATGFQVIYGILTRFFPRAHLLGIGNCLVGLFVMLTGLAQNFFQLATLRTAAGFGSSAQHPVGSAILISYFEKAKGRVLTLHHSAGNFGAFLGPAVAGGLLFWVGWRAVFLIVGAWSVLLGLCYFFLGDRLSPGAVDKKKTKATLREYIECLRNRNVMLVSLIQMAGAAGRGTGINAAFLTAFFMAALGVNVAVAAGLLMVYQMSGLVGSLGMGWLSDRFNRKRVVQLTLLGSTATTLWLTMHHAVTPWIVLNLILYGSMVQSRGSLTQSMVSEAVPLHKLDVAFSLYFFIGFISGPVWTFIMGWLIDAYGFSFAFKVVSVSYLLGMLLTSLTREPTPKAAGKPEGPLS